MKHWWQHPDWERAQPMEFSRRDSGPMVRVRGEFHPDGTPIRIFVARKDARVGRHSAG